ncbi:MAG: hypothetical protein A2Z20_12005 [Bdellovibrionales bacterium RBG_16_40_8]|nr:MAG: hypothetical protein A2Z20_12005 [Bdellovibrionales bacterium RBG_16_40_8]
MKPFLPVQIDTKKIAVQSRRLPRRKINKTVGLLARGKYVLVNTYEIGEGGMLIDSPLALIEGQKVVLTVRIPNILHGVVMSKVIYIVEPNGDVTTHRYGIEFDKIEFDIKRKIRNFVASGSIETTR